MGNNISRLWLPKRIYVPYKEYGYCWNTFYGLKPEFPGLLCNKKQLKRKFAPNFQAADFKLQLGTSPHKFV